MGQVFRSTSYISPFEGRRRYTGKTIYGLNPLWSSARQWGSGIPGCIGAEGTITQII